MLTGQVSPFFLHSISFNYNANGLLESIVDGTRTVTFNYDSNTNDLLTITKPSTAQYPGGLTKSFVYENHNIKKIQDPKLQYFVENFYDTEGRVFKQNLGGSDMIFPRKSGHFEEL